MDVCVSYRLRVDMPRLSITNDTKTLYYAINTITPHSSKQHSTHHYQHRSNSSPLNMARPNTACIPMEKGRVGYFGDPGREAIPPGGVSS